MNAIPLIIRINCIMATHSLLYFSLNLIVSVKTDIFYPQEGGTVELKCIASTGRHVQWNFDQNINVNESSKCQIKLKDDVIRTDDCPFEPEGFSINAHNSLVIKKLDPMKHGGWYYCHHEASAPNITFKHGVSPFVIRSSRAVKTNDVIYIPCDRMNTTGVTMFGWIFFREQYLPKSICSLMYVFKKSPIINQTSSSCALPNTVVYHRNASLRISAFDHVENEGFYACYNVSKPLEVHQLIHEARFRSLAPKDEDGVELPCTGVDVRKSPLEWIHTPGVVSNRHTDCIIVLSSETTVFRCVFPARDVQIDPTNGALIIKHFRSTAHAGFYSCLSTKSYNDRMIFKLQSSGFTIKRRLPIKSLIITLTITVFPTLW